MDIKSPVWVVMDQPYSSGLSYVFDKAWQDAGIRATPYVAFLTNIKNVSAFFNLLEQYQPPLICTMGEHVTSMFCPETSRKKKGVVTDESSLEKWAGSLLESKYISYPHYCIPILSPDKLAQNFEYRFVYVNIDLARVRDELDWYIRYKKLQPLPEYEMIINPSFTELREILYDFYSAKLLGSDIETIRPPKGSVLHGKHPGYAYLLALADTGNRGASFSLWDYTPQETLQLFRLLDDLLSTVPQVGQNYFTFDSHFLEALGLRVNLSISQDTMLRHQILWPELPHKLQFLTKHYTRQPYYKDEGKAGSPRNAKPWMKYNCMDAIITREIYDRQEEEFDDRPYLK
jgi:hypothetical protein